MRGKTPALSYLRVSGKGQIDGDGFDRQRDAIARFAARNTLDIVGEFRDEGVSGTKELANRPGLAALIDRLESNGVRVVVVERAPPRARPHDQRSHRRSADSAGCSSADGRWGGPHKCRWRSHADADTPGARSVAQFEKSVIVLKLHAARDRIRRRDGRCEGRKPFGSRPSEAAGANRIRQLRRKPKGKPRLSIAAIAEQLNLEGIPTRQGRPWRPSSVHAILRRMAAEK